MADLTEKEASGVTRVVGGDEAYAADVFLIDGVKKLQTSATATVESLFGEVVFPYTYELILGVGNNGDTIRTQIPDDSIDVTTTKTASEVTVHDLAKKHRDELNANVNFKPLYKAVVPRDSNQVCIQALLVQTIRSDVGDVLFTITGSINAVLGFDTILDRSIALALFPHPRDCRKGTINVTGEIGVVATGRPPKHIYLMDSGGSFEQNINASGAPIEFKLSNNTSYSDKDDQDFLITELRIEATTSAFSIGSNKYIKVSTLPNGHHFQVRSDGDLEYDETLFVTEDIHHKFVFGEGSKFDVIGQSAYSILAVFARPFYIRKAGTFALPDDVIVTLNDNLSLIGRYRVSAVGFFED